MMDRYPRFCASTDSGVGTWLMLSTRPKSYPFSKYCPVLTFAGLQASSALWTRANFLYAIAAPLTVVTYTTLPLTEESAQSAYVRKLLDFRLSQTTYAQFCFSSLHFPIPLFFTALQQIAMSINTFFQFFNTISLNYKIHTYIWIIAVQSVFKCLVSTIRSKAPYFSTDFK